jgi:REP element-mobilizing transposase RayT
MKEKSRQTDFAFVRWGGKRRGAGRKPKGEDAGVSHEKRPVLKARFPVLVTMKLRAGLRSLRADAEHAVIRAALRAAAREDFRVAEYSVQSNHLHLVVEAQDARRLSRGMGGLAVRLARRLNGLWKRAGQVFPERFHARILESPTAVRNALVYVLGNARKHGSWRARRPDVYSSGPSFDGWKENVAESSSPVIARARTWLLAKGWRRLGLLDPEAAPAAGKRRRRQVARAAA